MNLNEKLICTHISLVERKIIIIKTSITTIIVIINKATCIIIIFMDSAHTSLNSAGISLSRGKGRMDIRVVRQTKKTDRCFVDNDISVYPIYITTLFASEV